MEFRKKVHGSMLTVPDIEFNYGCVYIRFNVKRVVETYTVPNPDQEVGGVVEESHEIWEYDEWFMSDHEYKQIQQGYMPYNGHWDDNLRSVEREYKYEIADRMCMKYDTYAKDAAKLAAWTNYKAQIHATVNQPEYPRNVTYPTKPE